MLDLLSGRRLEQFVAIGIGQLVDAVEGSPEYENEHRDYRTSMMQAAIIISFLESVKAKPSLFWHEPLAKKAEVLALRSLGFDVTGGASENATLSFLDMDVFSEQSIMNGKVTIYIAPSCNFFCASYICDIFMFMFRQLRSIGRPLAKIALGFGVCLQCHLIGQF